MKNDLFSAFILGVLSGMVAAAVMGWQRQPLGSHDAYMNDEYRQVLEMITSDRSADA